jgi:transposase-like protein
MHPTAGTICHNSHIPLTDWFHAIYLMSTNKAGTTATQIQRELGCTYKTAWRMMHQIRKMMDNPNGFLIGEVEIDESYVHPNVYKRSSAQKRYGRTGNRTGQILFGIVQRGGAVKVWHVRSAGARVLKPLIRDNVKPGTLIHTDGYRAYKQLSQMGYGHRSTNHSIWEFYREDSYTQNIENVWSTMKPRWKGTFKHISPKYLQAYTNEFTWRYNHRKSISIFWALMGEFAEGTPSSNSG